MSKVTYVQVQYSFNLFHFVPHDIPQDGWWGFPRVPLVYDGTDISPGGFGAGDVPFEFAVKGSWEGGIGTTSGDFTFTTYDLFLLRATIGSVVTLNSTDPLPFEQQVGGRISYVMHDDLSNEERAGWWNSYAWFVFPKNDKLPDLFNENANSRNLDTLDPSRFHIGSAEFSLGGNDIVVLPSTVAKWIAWGEIVSADAYVPFHAGRGNDVVTGSGLREYICGDTGNDHLLGKAGDDGLEGGEGNDTLDGGQGNDGIFGGDGNDILIGSSGNDTLYGDAGDDVFDYVQTKGGPFSGFTASTSQSLYGGENTKTGMDVINLPFAPGNYKYVVTLGSTWESSTTTILYSQNWKLNFGTALYTFATQEIELAKIKDPISNPILEGNQSANQVKEATALALDIYNHGTDFNFVAEARGWHAVSAMELGIAPSDFGSRPDHYSFSSGIYDCNTNGQLLDSIVTSDAVCAVLSGVIAGEKSLCVDFKGSDPPGLDLWDWYADIGRFGSFKYTADYFKYYAPLFDGLLKYLHDNAGSFGQILLSGHSLGGAMVQEFMNYLSVFAPELTGRVSGYTFGSIGGTPVDSKWAGHMMNFVHTGDIANDLNALDSGRSGSIVWINTSLASLPPLQHSITYYALDVKFLVEQASASAPFARSGLAEVLRLGQVYKNGNIQVALGSNGIDGISSNGDDEFVLAGNGNDKIFLGANFLNLPIGDDMASEKGRIIDGGGGTEDTVFLAGNFENYSLLASPTGGTDIFKHALFGTGLVGTVFNVERFAYFDGVRDISGVKEPSQQRPSAFIALDASSAGVPTFSLVAGAGWADAGDGALKVVGSATADIIYLGSGDKTVFGNGGNDVMIVRPVEVPVGGTPDKIILNGGAGADMMIGGFGNETFYVDNVRDVVIDAGGHDKVISTVDFVLPDGIEDLKLAGQASSGVGNASDNLIIGGAVGGHLRGEDGNDSIVGGVGNDTLNGGAGHDSLTGGVGSDTFVFDTVLQSAPRGKSDIILDFNQGELDQIDLSGIDANTSRAGNQTFTFVDSAAFSGAKGELRYVIGVSTTTIFGDNNGDRNADFQLTLDGSISLTSLDFVL